VGHFRIYGIVELSRDWGTDFKSVPSPDMLEKKQLIDRQKDSAKRYDSTSSP